jgi:alkylation response protein AidB-like acyl-CoA dehydrogenase
MEAIKGGEFLIRDTESKDIFIPEEWNEEQKMISQTCSEFLETEVKPRLDEIDSQKDESLMPSLMDKAGALGLLGTSIPERFGGFGMNFNTSMLISEEIGRSNSFAVALSAHTGIGTLPILYYGTEEQKLKYLPKLASGEYKASYCLTEPDSGSDANSGKTKAELSEDGKHYYITGQKMWITNAGFADIFIVFAKIQDDKNLTAFIVEKSFGNITMNPEERKLGIKGSSTRQVFFNKTKVPVENMLSEREKGFKIAVNILNIGRIKLGSAVIGGSKEAMDHSIQYALERKQFGKSISEFGAIQHKLGEMASKLYATEAATYRAGQNIDDAYNSFLEKGLEPAAARLKSVEQFAIECAIIKVHASEVLDVVVDETVQIYGGMGFSEEAPAARGYRDARINRIFEGTNEINRMLTVNMLLKKAMKGELDLMNPAMKASQELMSIPDFGAPDTSLFAPEKKVLSQLKKAALLISGAAVQKLMMELENEQEILMQFGDALIEIYVAESVILRTEKLVSLKGEKDSEAQLNMMRIYLHHAVNIINNAGKEAIYAFAEGDEQRMLLMGLKRFTKIQPENLKEARRTVAKAVLQNKSYHF